MQPTSRKEFFIPKDLVGADPPGRDHSFLTIHGDLEIGTRIILSILARLQFIVTDTFSVPGLRFRL